MRPLNINFEGLYASVKCKSLKASFTLATFVVKNACVFALLALPTNIRLGKTCQGQTLQLITIFRTLQSKSFITLAPGIRKELSE